MRACRNSSRPLLAELPHALIRLRFSGQGPRLRGDTIRANDLGPPLPGLSHALMVVGGARNHLNLLFNAPRLKVTDVLWARKRVRDAEGLLGASRGEAKRLR
jgi:hypothetical protein